jgi:diguanylate cyclase (GGDEF)-like protein
MIAEDMAMALAGSSSVLWALAAPSAVFAADGGRGSFMDPAWAVAGVAVLAAVFLGWRYHKTHRRLEEGMAEMETTFRELADQLGAQTEALENASAQLEAQRATIEELRLTDPVTGLWNRSHVGQVLAGLGAQALRTWVAWNKGTTTNRPENADLLVFMLDLDSFGEANAALGKEVGERVLQELADVLRATSRTNDVLARWGEGAFLVARAGADRGSAKELAERLRDAVSSHVFRPGGGLELSTTCSVGFAGHPLLTHDPEALSWEDVVGLAEAALVGARNTGRGEWVGIVGDASTPSNGLPELLKDGPAGLINSGRLRVVTSFPEGTAVNWES